MRTLLTIFLNVLIFVASVLVYVCMAIYGLFFPLPPDERDHFLTPTYFEYPRAGSREQEG